MDDSEAKSADAGHATDHDLTLPTTPKALKWMVFLTGLPAGVGIGWKSIVIDGMAPMRAWGIAVGLVLFFWIPFIAIVCIEPRINRVLVKTRATGRSVWVALGIGTLAAAYYAYLILVVRMGMFFGMTLGASCDRCFEVRWRHTVIPAVCILGLPFVEYIRHRRTAACREASQRACEDV